MTEPVVVHILHHGRALCAFSNKVPADWPKGNKWVGLDERQFCTCAACAVADLLDTLGGEPCPIMTNKRDPNTPEDSAIIDLRMARQIAAWWRAHSWTTTPADGLAKLSAMTGFVQRLRADYIPTTLLPGADHDTKIDDDRRNPDRPSRRRSR